MGIVKKVGGRKRRRRYSETFKKARVKDYEEGTFSVSQMSRLYGIHCNVIYRWINRYSAYDRQNAIIVEVPNSQTEKVRLLEKKVADLERLLGQKQIKLDFYECLMEELKSEGVDVEKKSDSTEPWSGSCDATKKP